MENLMEMEYVINGEKYLVTVTKVEEASTEKELNCEECPCKDICDAGIKKPAEENIETIEFNGSDIIQVSLSSIPEGMNIDEWLDIVDKYGIILID